MQASPVETYIDAPSEVDCDVVGQQFEAKLLTKTNKAVSNAKITMSLDSADYNLKTDSKGSASLQIRLDDGQYILTTTFKGDSNYKPCSKQTIIKMNNTRVVDEGLTSSEIQSILDNAKPNNVILFKGDVYEDISLIINKRLVLIGNGNTVLKSNSNETVIEAIGKNSSLSSITGFNIQSNGNGIRIEDSDYVTVANNTISSNGSGIIAEGVKYLEIDNNNISSNQNNGIVLGSSSTSNVINNKISSNSKAGIAIANSDNIYIYYNSFSKNQNGIVLAKEIDDVYYGGASTNIHIGNNEITDNDIGINLEEAGDNISIDSNTINGNHHDGICIKKASKNVGIISNIINDNMGSGISVSKIGANFTAFYNLISYNSVNGITFNYDYTIPLSQDIRFNVIIHNPQNEIDASATRYTHSMPLTIGENWYGGILNICPKVITDNINFVAKQVGSYLFNVTFYDEEGNIVSQLPQRTVTHKVNNGRSRSFVMFNGTATFERDASDDDIIHIYVDMGSYSIVYKFDDPDYLDIDYPPYSPYVRPIEDVGKPYPNLPRPGLIEDIINDNPGDGGSDDNTGNNGENTNGNGGSIIGGDGNGGSSTGHGTGTGINGNGNSNADGNTNQNTNDANGTAVQASGSNSKPASSIGPTSNAPSPGEGLSAGSQSVIKKITIDEEDMFRVTGLSLIILLILLTIGFYYREDIMEMKSQI